MNAQINILDELIVDNFAGGGGASTGIELALGRPVNIAINHDPNAIAMHKVNHPYTTHYCESVWDINPAEICKGQSVGLAWFSPDCKHFSKAKGCKPLDKNIRGLAWVAVRWAATVKPRIIIIENVEEIISWCPLLPNGKPDFTKRGKTFNSFINALKSHGYEVDWKILKACDYGAPTIRKRFYLIARCDGKPIVWAEPTHGKGKLPYKTASDIIDWTIPCKSIFERKKPLAENTLKRIARGLEKFVINCDEPFIVSIGQTGFSKDRSRSIHSPLNTIVTKQEQCLVAPTLIQTGYGERIGQLPRVLDLNKPLGTIVSSGKHALVSAFISKYYGGTYEGAGSDLKEPLHTVTSKDHNAVVTSHLMQFNYDMAGQDLREPLNTVTAVGHFAEVRAFLMTYYGNGDDVGQKVNEPLRTITTKDRFGLVTIKGIDYQIVDIGMRMLEPHELFAAQGFPSDYIIDKDFTGKAYPKTAQVARCGNAVCPPVATALVKANMPEYCKKDITLMSELENMIAI